MPLHRKIAGAERLVPWLVGAVPIFLGLIICYWQAERSLVDDGELTASETVEHIERILDNVSGAATALLPLAGKPCADVQLALRDQVARRPYVRSTLLAEADRVYCSSLFGAFSEPLDASDYVEGELALIGGNSLTPGRALLLYRARQDGPLDNGQSALAALDGTHLINTLASLGRRSPVWLQVGADWLGADGQVRAEPPLSFALAPVSLTSARYPFSVHTGFAAGAAWQAMATRYPALLGLLALLGMLAGLACRWVVQRAHAPTVELRRALQAQEFVPYFQPVVRSDDRQWAGAEILMRWQHPREGLVRPDLFIPLAEDCGAIVPMTRSLMRQTAALLSPQAAHLSQPFHLAFNIAAAHCQDLDLLEDCRQFLAAFPPGCIKLVLELTERAPIQPTDTTRQLFAALHELGVMIALDDFGTGHSSLAYLQSFKIDCLKIDQSFVAQIGVEALSGHILDNVIDLCHRLALQIVAEGVETAEQAAYLSARNVDYLQGYLFARPMPGGEFVAQLPAR